MNDNHRDQFLKPHVRDPRVAVRASVALGGSWSAARPDPAPRFGLIGLRAAAFASSRQARFARLVQAGLRPGLPLARPAWSPVVLQRLHQNFYAGPALRLAPHIHLTVLGPPAPRGSTGDGEFAPGRLSSAAAFDSFRRRIFPPGLDPRTVFQAPAASLRLAAVRSTAPAGRDLAVVRPSESPESSLSAAASSSAALAAQQRAVQAAVESARLTLRAGPGLAFRLARRQERRPLVAPDEQEATTAGGFRPVPPALRRLRARPAPQAAEPPPPGPAAVRDVPTWPGQAAQPLELAQHEIQRLADQVVRVIDGRIIAHNERLGRV